MYSLAALSLYLLGAAALPTGPGAADISTRQSSGVEANDLVNGDCAQVVYIFARGTTEPGNMGTTVGPALEEALKDGLGANNVAVQGVDYPADFAGAVQGSIDPAGGEGAQEMTRLAELAADQCPDSAVMLVGYSQGAQQVHGAMINLGANNNVAAAVTFGDPLQADPFENINQADTQVFCNRGDLVCDNQFIITAAHLSYPFTSVPDAADFIQQTVA